MPTKSQTILGLVKEGKLTPEQAAHMLSDSLDGFRIKVSEKGGISVYFPGWRYPVTYYAGQWERILEHSTDIISFIADNRRLLEGIRKRRRGY